MEKFTQGPWMVNKSIPTYIYNYEHGSICRIHFINSRELNSLEESSANAALISAAPDMYQFGQTTAEVLQILLERLGPKPEGLNAEIKRLCEERISEWNKIQKKARGER